MRTIVFALCAIFTALCVPSEARAQTRAVPIIGDSISSFVSGGQARDLSWSVVTQERDVVFRNLSQPGAQLGHPGYFGSNDIITTLDRLCGWAAINCHGVIVQAGINDYGFGTSWSAYVESLNRIIQWGADRGKPIILLDLLWAGDEGTPNQAGKTLGDYRTHRFFMGLQHGHVYFCGRPAEFNYDNPALYGSDDHPNTAGHRALATWIEGCAATAGFF